MIYHIFYRRKGVFFIFINANADTAKQSRTDCTCRLTVTNSYRSFQNLGNDFNTLWTDMFMGVAKYKVTKVVVDESTNLLVEIHVNVI